MKTLLFALTLMIAGYAPAQDATAYQQAMQQALTLLDSAETGNDYQAAANQFERIGQVASDEWLPAYYAAFCHLNRVSDGIEKDQIDPALDQVETLLGQARERGGDESELQVLQGWTHQMRINVKPMQRGQKYSGLAREALGAAIEANPDNPRAYYMMGTNIFYTPKMFGGGAEKALPHFENAVAKAEAFTHDNPFWPTWGGAPSAYFLEKCKEEIDG